MKKFSFCVGNPPYQESQETTRDKPVYHYFMDAANEIADSSMLITPGKFLFNAGATPKAWNEKMLNDKNMKVMLYNPDSSSIFPNVVFPGGVAITYHDYRKDFGAIGFFSTFPQVNSCLEKMKSFEYVSFSTIMYGQGSYRYTEKMHAENPGIKYNEDERGNNLGILSKGHDNDIATSALEKLDGIITFSEKPDDGHEYIKIIGRKGNERSFGYIRRDYVCDHPNLWKYKVLLSKADGAAGTIGKPVPARITGKPVVAFPGEAHTQTFLSIGCFETKEEAENTAKYITTKFCRFLLGALKATQDNPPEKWKFVPLQDFTSKSDINWNTSVSNIDKQLYKKYGFSEEEIKFIETNVKEMV